MNAGRNSHLPYLEDEFMGTAAQAVAEEIEDLVVRLSWCESDYSADCLRRAIDAKRAELSKVAA